MCDTESFGPVSHLCSVNHKCMHYSKPQHNSLKVTRNATNRVKHINEASKQIFVNNLFKESRKYTQGMLSNWKICFHVFNILTYDELFCTLKNIIKLFNERPLLTSQFDVSKLHKQLGSVIQTHFDQSANFGRLSLIVCVTVSHSINC